MCPRIRKVAAQAHFGFILDPFGVAINGVPLDPGANEWWNRDRNSGWQYEPMTGHLNLGVDESNAHVQPNGAYHYHGLPIGLIANVPDAKGRMLLLGWAADGFPIYAPWGYANATNAQSPLKDFGNPVIGSNPGTRPRTAPAELTMELTSPILNTWPARAISMIATVVSESRRNFPKASTNISSRRIFPSSRANFAALPTRVFCGAARRRVAARRALAEVLMEDPAMALTRPSALREILK